MTIIFTNLTLLLITVSTIVDLTKKCDILIQNEFIIIMIALIFILLSLIFSMLFYNDGNIIISKNCMILFTLIMGIITIYCIYLEILLYTSTRSIIYENMHLGLEIIKSRWNINELCNIYKKEHFALGLDLTKEELIKLVKSVNNPEQLQLKVEEIYTRQKDDSFSYIQSITSFIYKYKIELGLGLGLLTGGSIILYVGWNYYLTGLIFTSMNKSIALNTEIVTNNNVNIESINKIIRNLTSMITKLEASNTELTNKLKLVSELYAKLAGYQMKINTGIIQTINSCETRSALYNLMIELKGNNFEFLTQQLLETGRVLGYA